MKRYYNLLLLLLCSILGCNKSLVGVSQETRHLHITVSDKKTENIGFCILLYRRSIAMKLVVYL